MEATVGVAGSLMVALISAAAGIIVWSLNERSKRRAAEYRRREWRYRSLIAGINAFYAPGSESSAGGNVDGERERFLREIRLIWLYCPDSVVRAGNRLLQAMLDESPVGDPTEAGRACVAALRRDLVPGTDLRGDEFVFASPRRS